MDDPYGCPYKKSMWIFHINLHNLKSMLSLINLLDLKNRRGFNKIYMDFDKSTWIKKYTWIPKTPHGFQQIHTDPKKSTWIPTNSRTGYWPFITSTYFKHMNIWASNIWEFSYLAYPPEQSHVRTYVKISPYRKSFTTLQKKPILNNSLK